MDMIRLVLENNTFCLGANDRYIQNDGTAIGSRLGMSYACTNVGSWETELLARTEVKPLIFYRFVDDIFGVFIGAWTPGASVLGACSAGCWWGNRDLFLFAGPIFTHILCKHFLYCVFICVPKL